MKAWAVAACFVGAASGAIGCDATARYKTLSFFFDGVPAPAPVEATPAPGRAAAATQARRVGYRAHGPYGAKLCNACHDPGGFNALVLPPGELCFKCHELAADKQYVHGPLASGGCTACHDPHSSQYRYLLVAESDSFCLRCHEPAAVARIPGHADVEAQCTTCHDPHMSDKKYLLR